MAYRNKQETIELAEKFGIDVSDMTWPEMQRAVKQALDNESGKLKNKKPRSRRQINADLRINDKMKPYYGKKVFIAPEAAPNAQRYMHWSEELGDEVEVEEVSMLGMEGGRINWNDGSTMKSGTYRIKNKTGRKVIAQSAMPRQNAGIDIDAGIDFFPVIQFRGKKGYLYKHPRMQCFKKMLEDRGVYEDYRQILQRNGTIFYLTGLLCIDIPIAHSIMKDIEKRYGRGELDRWGV